MSQDDKPFNLWRMADQWPVEDLQRLIDTYGEFTLPNAKGIRAQLKDAVWVRGEYKTDHTKQEMGGLLKSAKSMQRLTEIRLLYLYLTLDMGMDQLLARSEVAKAYELSKSRIRDLVSVPKSKKPKK